MRLSGLLLLVFIVVPLIEIGLFIEIGGVIGALPTIGLIILTAVIGVALIRLQGMLTLARVREKLDRREVPAIDLIEGLILLVAAALLLTPGFFTDGVGFLVLVPGIRRTLATQLLKWLIARERASGHRANGQTTVIIDGEVVEGQPEAKPYRGLKGRESQNYNQHS